MEPIKSKSVWERWTANGDHCVRIYKVVRGSPSCDHLEWCDQSKSFRIKTVFQWNKTFSGRRWRQWRPGPQAGKRNRSFLVWFFNTLTRSSVTMNTITSINSTLFCSKQPKLRPRQDQRRGLTRMQKWISLTKLLKKDSSYMNFFLTPSKTILFITVRSISVPFHSPAETLKWRRWISFPEVKNLSLPSLSSSPFRFVSF